MKELIKPTTLEQGYSAAEELTECGQYCRGEPGRETCNKVCSGGANNTTPVDDTDILF